jgi:hypothetical protein
LANEAAATCCAFALIAAAASSAAFASAVRAAATACAFAFAATAASAVDVATAAALATVAVVVVVVVAGVVAAVVIRGDAGVANCDDDSDDGVLIVLAGVSRGAMVEKGTAMGVAVGEANALGKVRIRGVPWRACWWWYGLKGSMWVRKGLELLRWTASGTEAKANVAAAADTGGAARFATCATKADGCDGDGKRGCDGDGKNCCDGDGEKSAAAKASAASL